MGARSPRILHIFLFRGKMINKRSLQEVLFDAERIDFILKRLTATEKYVIENRFQLNNRPFQTLQELANYYKVTPERIRQVEAKAIIKMRKDLHYYNLQKNTLSSKSVLSQFFSIRLVNVLLNAKIINISQLDGIDFGILAGYKNFGKKSLAELKQFLDDRDIPYMDSYKNKSLLCIKCEQLVKSQLGIFK